MLDSATPSAAASGSSKPPSTSSPTRDSPAPASPTSPIELESTRQLISYYFGGKEGVYDELLAGWHQREATLADPSRSLADVVVAYLAANHDQPEMARLLVWDGLTAHSGAVVESGDAPEVTDIRRRQAEGEIAADLDPAFLLLALMGAVAAGVTMPQMVTRLCGVAPKAPSSWLATVSSSDGSSTT